MAYSRVTRHRLTRGPVAPSRCTTLTPSIWVATLLAFAVHDKERHRYVRKLAGAMTVALLLSAASGAPVHAAKPSALIGPSGGNVSSGAASVLIPGGAYLRPTRVSVRLVRTSVRSLGSSTHGRSDSYRIQSSTPPVTPVTVRIRLPRALSAAGARRAAMASLSGNTSGWALHDARVSGSRRIVSIKTVTLGVVQVRELTAATARRTAKIAHKLRRAVTLLARGAGIRASKRPTCSTPPADRTLVLDAMPVENPPAFVCLDGIGGEIALRIVNNRATSLQFAVPPSMRIAKLNGQSVAGRLADSINQGSGPRLGRRRLVPAGGSLVLIGTPPVSAVTFRPALTAVLFDTLALLLTRSDTKALERAGRLARFAQCVWNVTASNLPEGILKVMKDCKVPHSALAQIQFGLGALQNLVGIAQGINGLYRHRITVNFPVPINGPSGILGRWVGPVEQTPFFRPYMVDMTINRLTPGSVAGDVLYPELSCGGPVTYLGATADGAGWTFREDITFGTCIDDGHIEIRPAPGGRSWLWTEVSNRTTAVATLTLAPPGPPL